LIVTGTVGPSGSQVTVPANATAVAINVTATDTSQATFFTIYPFGAPQPGVSNVNAAAGETVPNLAFIPVGSSGQITIYNDAGTADVIVDLEGYFAPETSGSAGSYDPVTSDRIADTRTGSGEPYAGDTLHPGSTQAIQVTGVADDGVPATGVTAVVLNVTVTDTTAPSFLTVFDPDHSMPLASNLNWGPGVTVANRVVVPVSSTGQIAVYNQSGNVDVIVDVNGYFNNGSSPSANDSLYMPITPARVVDTRHPTDSPLGPGVTDTEQLGGQDGIAPGATAAVTNVTATDTTTSSYFTVYPGGTQPLASDLNWSAGQTVPNLTLATLSNTGTTDVYNSHGYADLIIDAFGYFSPVSPPVPAMVSAVVSAGSIAITYNQSVACPSTGADTDFTYDSTNGTSGGGVSGCTASGDVLTLTPSTSFTTPTGTASILYTAPGTSTTANAAYSAVYPDDFAATQTLGVGTGPAMVSASVTASSIAITYNKGVFCPATGADTDFAYDYTTGTSGGTVGGCTTSGDVLTLTPATSTTFTLPTGSTGSIVYTAPTPSTTSNAVYAAGNNFAATQTLQVFAVPAMVSATVSSSDIVVTYNEAVSCPATGADTDFTYDTTGATSGGAVGGCTTSGTVLTLTPTTTFATPATGASTLIYTVPTTNSSSTAVYATDAPSDYAADQTLNLGPVPAMVSAAVTSSQIQIIYNESVTCKSGGTAYSDFSYNDGSGDGGSPAGCTFSSDTLTLSGTFTLPTGSSASITYMAPTPSTISNAVYATGTTTNFAATQTLTGFGTPVMESTAWTASSIQVTYDEAVSCGSGAPSDFMYYSAGTTSGGTVTTCSNVSADVLTLGGSFAPPTDSGTLTYTVPAPQTTSTAVYETGSPTNFAATQTVDVRPVPTMVSAVVDTSTNTIAITYNTDVSCDPNPGSTTFSDFSYSDDGGTAGDGGDITSCGHTNTTVTLYLTGTTLAPGADAYITYTLPGTNSQTTAVYATAVPSDYAVGQTLSSGITGS
jgi:hypothetical protein